MTDLASSLDRRWLRAAGAAVYGAASPLIALTLLKAVLAGALAAALTGTLCGVAWAPAALAFAVVARAAAILAATRLATRQARQVKSAIRRQVIEVTLSRHRGGAAFGDCGALAIESVEVLDGYFARFRPAQLDARLGPALIVILAAIASPVAAAILLATLVPFIFLMALAGGAASDAAARQLEALARLSGVFVDRVRALPAILAFQGEATETSRIATSAVDVAERTLSVLRIAFVSTAALEFFAALSVALVAVYCGFSLLHLLPFPAPERLNFPRAFFALALAPEFYAPMRRLAGAYHDKQLGEAAAGRLRSALSAAEVARQSGASQPTAPPTLDLKELVLRLGDVEVGPVDLVAPAGRITALVGETGSGKSSILAAILGQLPLHSGAILVDGRVVDPVRDLAGAISWAGQSPAFLPGTVLDNLMLAAPGTSAAAARAMVITVGLGPALDRRPGGEALVLDERGSGLSGGERRRLALARALLKPAPLLLLDEPTADLDPSAESDIITLLRACSVGRTVVVATHSSVVAAAADQIVRLA